MKRRVSQSKANLIIATLALGMLTVLLVREWYQSASTIDGCRTLNSSAPVEVLMLGNSLLHDFDWPLPGAQVLNCAKQGQTLSEFMSRWQAVSEGVRRPDHIVIAFGTVEVVRSEQDDRHIQTFMEVYPPFLASVRRRWPEARILVNLLPDINSQLFGRPQLDTGWIEQLNRFIRETTKCSNCQLIDLPTVLAQGELSFDEALTYDGVHLTQQGYERWLAALADAMAAP